MGDGRWEMGGGRWEMGVDFYLLPAPRSHLPPSLNYSLSLTIATLSVPLEQLSTATSRIKFYT